MANTKSPGFQAHVKALQTLYGRVQAYRENPKVEGLLWLFSGMDDFGGPYQEVDFVLKKIDYSPLKPIETVKSIDSVDYFNNTDAPQVQDLSRTFEESSQTTYTFLEGFRIGTTVKMAAGIKGSAQFPVLKIIGGELHIDMEVTETTEFSFQAQETFTKSKKNTLSITQHITVPERKRVTAQILLSKGQFHGEFTATFECMFTTYGLKKYKQSLAEIAPKVNFCLESLGLVSGDDNVGLRVVTEQIPIEELMPEFA